MFKKNKKINEENKRTVERVQEVIEFYCLAEKYGFYTPWSQS
jgi:hypothetical protein